MVSAKFTPTASTCTMTSPGLGLGSGTSRTSRTSGPPGRVTTMAFMKLDCTTGMATERLLRRYLHEVQRARDVVPEIAAMHDGVEHAVLEEKFAALEAFGQLLADGLLDHTRPGEADERSRFGDVQIAQHGE